LKCLQGCRKECAQRDLFSKRPRSCEESSGGREAFRIIERLHRRFSCQEIPKGKEIDGQDLTEEIDKTRQPLDLAEVRGGYDHTRAQAREDAEPLDQQVISRQPLDLEELHRG
jgi:hypothetical protein